MEHKSHGSPSFINIAVLLLFAVVIAVASTVTTYFFLSSRTVEQPAVTQTPIVPPTQTNMYPTTPPTTQTTVPTDETANWKVYRNKLFGFTLKYPPTFIIKDNLSLEKNRISTSNEYLTLKNPSYEMLLFINGGSDAPSWDKYYDIVYSYRNGITVVRKKNRPYSSSDSFFYNDPNKTTINTETTVGNNHFYFSFSFETKDITGETIFKQILSTFKSLE